MAPIYSVTFMHLPGRREFTSKEREALGVDTDDNCFVYRGEHPLAWMKRFPLGSVFEIQEH